MTEKVEVPENVRVQCPMLGKIVKLDTCNDCQHYRGLKRRFENNKMSFAQLHLVACAFPRGLPLLEEV